MSDTLIRITDDKRRHVQARKAARPLGDVEAAARGATARAASPIAWPRRSPPAAMA